MQKILFPDLPKRTPEIRITPLIDILLLLLIFFTISSRLRWNPGLTLDLPQASSSVPVDRPMRLLVMIDEEGTVYLQGEEVAADALGAELKAALTELGPESPTLELEADRRAPYGSVLGVIDEARGLGLEKIIAFTETAEEAQ